MRLNIRSVATGLFLAIASMVAANPTLAQIQVVPTPIAFDGATAVIKARVTGKEVLSYSFDGEAGEHMTITLEAPTPSANFNVQPLGDPQAIFVGAREGVEFDGALPAAGTYEIRVFLMGQAAETGKADFTLTVGKESAGDMAPDYADGLSGGPDFWQVTGLTAGDTLNLRAGPSTSANILAKLRKGTVLRNLGCRMEGSTRWCEVEGAEDSSMRGWVAGRYLQEAAAPISRPGDALVPGTNYHAVGSIPCGIEADPSATACEFGVTRGAPGLATVFITLPNGFVRVIKFDLEGVEPMSAVQSFTFDKVGDETEVNVDNGAETYRIPDAVIFGG